MKKSFEETKNDDVKLFAAAVLLRIGCRDQTVSTYLVEVLKKGSPYLGMIAFVLGSSDIKEASEILECWLSKWNFVADPYTAATLISALKKLKGYNSPIILSLQQQELPQNVKLALAS